MLRRKRGAEFDLSDSDDDVEARRRRKRREFAKMRKALLENEKLGKIAEDPKKLAFLRAIEDREDDPDMNFLDQPDENSQETQEIPDSQPLLEANSLKRKRGLQDAAPDVGNRPGPQARRTSKAKRPSTLAEIRESVSFLIEEADGGLGQPSSDVSDGEHEATALPFAAADHPIIDRISLKRAESAALASASTRLAFHDPSSSTAGPAFRVPSLLRRATMQAPGGPDRHGISTAAGTERAAGGGEQGDFVRRGGTKKSSINYRAREQQRSKGQEAERRREERRQRAGALRQGGVLGALGGGTFE
jgi:mediator of replication checkpoint protein 1